LKAPPSLGDEPLGLLIARLVELPAWEPSVIVRCSIRFLIFDEEGFTQ
jgi:hypothetical protein